MPLEKQTVPSPKLLSLSHLPGINSAVILANRKMTQEANAVLLAYGKLRVSTKLQHL